MINIKKSSIWVLMLLNSTSIFSRFILVTSLYNETRSPRIIEYKECLEKNLKNKLIDKIHILYDTLKDNRGFNVMLPYLKKLESQGKVVLSYIKGRPSFGYMFDFVNKKYPKKNIIISNADIYFNHTFKRIKRFDLNNTLISLTRWNAKPSGLQVEILHGKPNMYSHDVWIFKTPMRNFAKNKKFTLGTLHFETPLDQAAQRAGYKVINPLYAIQCCHLHNSNLR